MSPKGTLDETGNGPAWRVIKVSDVPSFDAATGDRTAKRIDYVLFDGSTSYIIVPLSKYEPEIVQAMLDERAAKDIEIARLEGAGIFIPPQTTTTEFPT